MIGEVVGNFKITALLGKGGMGEVWHAEHTTVGTHVAIKTLRAEISADEDHVKRFFNEAVIAGKIRHAGTVSIFDVGFQAGRAYLVMELLEGVTLAQRIRQLGRLPLARVCDIGRQLASVLQATHDAGITHRDLKPDNIFLVPDADSEAGERVKVLDFGIAKLGGGVGMTSTSMSSMGTPLYMSPEQWRSVAKVDWRADAYSLGCVVFEMACGQPPFLAQSMGEACAKHLTEPPPAPTSLVPALPAGFDVLVARLLDKEPLRRPKIRDVMVAFEAIAADQPVVLGESQIPTLGGARSEAANAMAETMAATSPEAAAPPPPAPAPVPRRRNRVIAIGALAAAAFGGTAIVLSLRDDAPVAPVVAPAIAIDAPAVAVVAPPADAAVAIDAGPAKPDRLVSAKKLSRTRGEVPVVATRVPLELCIDATGAVTHVRIFDDVPPAVVDAVTPAVMAWRYAPYLVDGVATAVCSNDVLAPKREKPVVVAAAGSGAGAGAGSAAEDRSRYPERLPDHEIDRAIQFAERQMARCSDTGGGSVRVEYTVNMNGRVETVTPTPIGPLGQCVSFALRAALFAPTRAGFRGSYSTTIAKPVKPPAPQRD